MQNQFNGQTLASINGNNAPNPLLQPFTVTEKEIGLELRLFKNRLLLDIAAFDKVTTDQIIDVNTFQCIRIYYFKRKSGLIKKQWFGNPD